MPTPTFVFSSVIICCNRTQASSPESSPHAVLCRLCFVGLQVSRDGQRLCTTSADKSIKFYDVVSFDMSHMIALKYTPTRATWIHERGRKARK